VSLIGRTLGRYEIVAEISRGGMGVVYRARDVRLNREVALKVLPPELVADPDRRQRFVQEARAASALEHPHIAVIHEIDEVDGVSFIAMELVRGDKLSDLTGRGPLPAHRALEIATEIAEGLARAHDKNIVHRDLKPANVMLTEDGHAKIIDFGLAKLIEALGGHSAGVTVGQVETHPGVVLGTVSYMAPEQARGGQVDHRCDIFSFGVLLHEMLTGRPPFRGATGLDTMHAILHDPVAALPPLGASVTAEAVGDLQRLLEKCLAKEPESRYQGMRDIVVDLRATRRRLESTSVNPVVAAAPAGTSRAGLQRTQAYAYGAVAIVVLILAGVGYMTSRWSAPAPSAPATSGKPSVAVLYFENNTGNPQLDWLRTGLTDMLVTDLSQSPDIEVLGTDRLVQVLTAMRRQDDRAVSFDTVQELAKRAGVTSVLLGSYVKAGEVIRINIKLQDAATGRIVSAERVEAAGESSLFATVDELTRRIKEKFSLPGRIDPTAALIARPGQPAGADGPLDRDLKDVTTSSIEAYRYYADGINLHDRLREREAIAPLEKAIAIDPGFAMALAKLAVVHANQGHGNLYAEYARRAFEHSGRISPRERYYVEGMYYANRNETFGKAIDAYKKAIEMFPDHASARHNLALQYQRMERVNEAIPMYEELRRRDMTAVSASTNLSENYQSLGQYERAEAVLQDYLQQNPDSAQVHLSLGIVRAAWGKLDDAMAAFDKAAALAPDDPAPLDERRAVWILRERWTELEAGGQKLRRSADPGWRLTGNLNLAEDRLLKGRTAEALKFLSAAAAGGGPTGSPQSAAARNVAAVVLVATGDAAAALAEARRALEDAHGIGPQPRWSLSLIALAASRAGHAEESRKAADELERRIKLLPSENHKRIVNQLAARFALDKGDTARAIEELTRAEARVLPAPITTVSNVVPIAVIFDLGSAYLAAGNDVEAGKRFQRIVDGGTQRIWNPLDFVRSLYHLGQIHERRGDRAKAAEYYRRFVDYWGEGDIDREKVADAKRRIGTGS
jgi:tetratricopeptide (TPR) repeat protein/TolB-like protein